MDELTQRLHARGWRFTPQRRSVVEALRGDHVHLTADEIHARAQRRVPEVSLATVYNTVNELVGMGEVQEVVIAGDAKRYDPNVGDGHHHLLCVDCGELLDVRPEGQQDLELPEEQRHGYQVDEVEITFRGRCPDCRAG